VRRTLNIGPPSRAAEKGRNKQVTGAAPPPLNEIEEGGAAAVRDSIVGVQPEDPVAARAVTIPCDRLNVIARVAVVHADAALRHGRACHRESVHQFVEAKQSAATG
jgi:hypothetical protein